MLSEVEQTVCATTNRNFDVRESAEDVDCVVAESNDLDEVLANVNSNLGPLTEKAL